MSGEPEPSTSSGGPTVNFQKTKRGGQILCRAGYNYGLKRKNRDGSELWRYTNRDSCKCFATIKAKQSPFVVLHETAHNHPPKEYAEIEIERQMHLCIETVQKNINKPVPQIFDDAIQNLSDQGLNLVNNLPKFNNIKNKLYKKRNSSVGAKKLNFSKSRDVQIPEKFENLLFAEFKHKSKRILIFGNKEMIKYLKKSTRFLIDGTFKICPKCFYQVYTIHADIGSNHEYVNVVPVLYALLPDKKRVTYYDTLFQIIKGQVKEWEPTHISMDFEMNAISAIKDLFPEVKIIGCIFHFSRSLWRKAKKLGVVKSKQGVTHVKLCTALSHLPPHLLDDGWMYVMAECPNSDEITQFNDYFVRTWLENDLFSNTWNTFGEIDRTNNMVESWNSKIKKTIPEKPNIAQFLAGIQKDAKFYCGQLERNGDLRISKRKPETIEKNRKINNIIEELMTGEITIGHCLEKMKD